MGYFGESRSLRTIVPGDADCFRLHLLAQKKKDGSPKYQPASLSKHIEIAKLFFGAAVRDRVIDQNPFDGFASRKKTNPAREYFLARTDADKCIAAAPDAQWRLIIALARYGGLRTPSEQIQLRWQDILWDQERFTDHSPKTEHHDGKGSRIVPLYPELRPYLEEAFELAEDGAEFVITRYRDGDANLRTTFQKIIKRAGLVPWPKLFQNMRSTRQTELEADHPTHVVCSWMGNGPRVSQALLTDD